MKRSKIGILQGSPRWPNWTRMRRALHQRW